MNNIRYEFAKDINTKTLASYGRLDTRQPLCTLPISAKDLTPDGSQWFHAVDAYADTKTTGQRVIRIRVITKYHRGVNITIPRTDILYQKFRDLRYLIRNSDYVQVSFPNLFVMGSPLRHELHLRAYDFKVCLPDDDSEVDDSEDDDFII